MDRQIAVVAEHYPLLVSTWNDLRKHDTNGCLTYDCDAQSAENF